MVAVGTGGPTLLGTKLHAPRLRRGAVDRPRLTARLGDTRDRAPVTLVAAPAGFGKTTLLTSWLATEPRVAWFSIDAADNDPALFWAYVVAALRSVDPAVGEEAARILAASPGSVEPVVASLINDLDALADDVVLVLDDYHLVESDAIHEGLALLVDHLPPTAHLVIGTRADPPLPLARLRARGELAEVRAADLRFTAAAVSVDEPRPVAAIAA